jgi:L-2,4-diaminobutyrate transaminase
MIMDRAPDHMARVYFGLSGSDANETNVKLAWHYNILRGKPKSARSSAAGAPITGRALCPAR